MITARRLLALPALCLALGVTGCSFQGSVRDAASSAPTSAGSPDSPSPATAVTSAPATSSGSPSAPRPVGAPSTPAGGTATSPLAGTTATTGSATARCRSGDLRGTLTPGDPGAGQRYATLGLTNTGSRTCTITGFGGLQLVGADGAPLPTTQVRTPSPAARTVALAPGRGATSLLHWSAVPGTGDAPDGPCQPAATALRVIPPDETTALSVGWSLGPVCEAGRITQAPYAG